MLPMLLATTLLFTCEPEPDGSRTLGVVPPFQGQPAPPRWLRAASHELAQVACRHYVYEAYGDSRGHWLVCYRSLPGAGEGEEGPQAFLFGADAQGRRLICAEIRFSPKRAELQGAAYVLVDRRDLLKP